MYHLQCITKYKYIPIINHKLVYEYCHIFAILTYILNYILIHDLPNRLYEMSNRLLVIRYVSKYLGC